VDLAGAIAAAAAVLHGLSQVFALVAAPSFDRLSQLGKSLDPRRHAARATAMQLVNEAF
jgi:hypothetical protein